jgi:hypothetical protein
MSRRYVLGYAVSVGAGTFGVTYGSVPLQVAGLVLGVAFGVTVGARTVPGRGRVAIENAIAGYALGVAVSLVVGATLFSRTLGAPLDFAFWRVGLDLGRGWVLVATLGLLGSVTGGLVRRLLGTVAGLLSRVFTTVVG